MQKEDSLHTPQKEDKIAFKELFDLYYRALVLFAEKQLNDIQSSEDIVQECYISLWNNREQIEDTTKIKNILYISVRNRCLNYIRDQKIRQEHYDRFLQEAENEEPYETTLIENEVRSSQMKMLDLLSKQGKKIFLLSMDGMKVAEIAEKLSISLNTVKYHKKQIKKIIAKIYRAKS